jgi:SAM-dependent methyltransferase
MMRTDGTEYTARLARRSGAWWKRLLDTQAPYRRNLRRLDLGHVLDIGCGIGRNLANLNGRAVGIDTNPHSVAAARSRGFVAYTPEEFAGAPEARESAFDSLLFAHVLEHMPRHEAIALVGAHLPHLRAGGRVVIIVPQEAGFRSDPTHVEFLDVPEVTSVLDANGLEVLRAYSFPFPRRIGRFFTHNETVVVAERRSG